MEEQTTADAEGAAEPAGGSAADAGAKEGKREEKTRRTPGEQANAKLRAARRSLREVTDPDAKARFTFAEAEVLALLAVADSLGNGSSQSD